MSRGLAGVGETTQPNQVELPSSPVTGSDSDYDELLELVGRKRVVLLGEASHGSHEFYRERARITKRLIEECGFSAVLVEADWPDAYRANRYVQGKSADQSAEQSLGDFKRFPAWMWRNTEVVNFLEWLRARNDATKLTDSPVGFYGLDLYSLHSSIEAVIAYLEAEDPAAARDARERYDCFGQVIGDGIEYGRQVALRVVLPCEDQVVAELVALRARSGDLLAKDGWAAEDEYFYAEQNARLVLNAERYYRLMYQAGISAGNLRDWHMAETLKHLVAHLDRQIGEAKVVVWAHNSHVGDARETEMGQRGELNIGQLARQTWPGDCALVGFTTERGEVTAASDWGGPAERKTIRPATLGSYEHLLGTTSPGNFCAALGGTDPGSLPAGLLERAIGVIYRPQTERASHWFRADLAAQFDAVIHIAATTAVEPLERTSRWDRGEPPETFPTGY